MFVHRPKSSVSKRTLKNPQCLILETLPESRYPRPGLMGLPCSHAGCCTAGALGAHGPVPVLAVRPEGHERCGLQRGTFPFLHQPTLLSCSWKQFPFLLPSLARSCAEQLPSHSLWPSEWWGSGAAPPPGCWRPDCFCCACKGHFTADVS